MINKVILAGRITKDPSLSKTQSGISAVRFTVACNRRFAKEGQQQADFISCVAWRQSADFMANYVKKGALLGIEGSIQTGSYSDKSGKTIYTTDVVCDNVQILEQKRDEPNKSQSQPAADYHAGIDYKNDDYDYLSDINEDDLPF